MRVLFIEDDSAAAQSVLLTLQAAEFEVCTTELGHQGIELAKQDQYDIIMLDLDLPDISGFEVLRSLRTSGIRTPILVLSGYAGLDEKVKALGLGADDYMTKPFHKDELIARITAIVRRSKRPLQSVVQIGELVINLDRRVVELAGVRLHLTVKEYDILAALAIRKGSTLTKEMLLTQLYGGLHEPGLKIIDVFLCKIRKKLRAASKGKNYIETIWGRGYVLLDPDQEVVSAPV